MKKLALVISSMAMALGVFAQGTVTFNNGGGSVFTLSSNGVSLGTAPAAAIGTYYFALLDVAGVNSAASGNPGTNVAAILSGTWTFTGVIGTNTVSAGRMSSGLLSGETAGSWPIASSNWCVAVGWSTSIGAAGNWLQASNIMFHGLAPVGSFWGISVLGANVAGGLDPVSGLTIPSPTLFGANPGQLPNIDLQGVFPVPEPTSFALLGLGAAALLVFRRRK